MARHERFRLAGVMGWPIMHSRSPRLHNRWLEIYGIAGAYVPFAIEPGGLQAALRALAPLHFSGVNLTIPHKEAALAFVDRVEPAARAIGAINCVVVEPDGTLVGHNFDSFGFIASLREADPDWKAEQGPAAVIGAGGGARAIIHGLLEAGAREVRVVNRTMERAQELRKAFGEAVRPVEWSRRADALEGCALLVNATSLGMVGQGALDLPLRALPREALVADIVYAPLETALLAEARARGNRAVDGLGMLIHQARPAFAAWFGTMPEATPAIRAMMESTI